MVGAGAAAFLAVLATAAGPANAAPVSIFTVAGGGTKTAATGLPATSVRIAAGGGVAPLASGGFLVGTDDLLSVGADGLIGRVVPARELSPESADNAQSVAPTADGGAFIATFGGRLLRMAADGSLHRISGLEGAADVSVAGDGSVLIAEPASERIQRRAPDGTLTTVAGIPSDQGGFGGDGGAATSARLSDPRGVAALPDGGFLIADTGNRRIRRVTAAGRIDTVAGTGADRHAGDGGPALAAAFSSPLDVTVAADGSVLVADNDTLRDRGRVRSFTLGGPMATVAGGDAARAYGVRLSTSHPSDAFDSDGVTAARAGLPAIGQVSATSDGGILLFTFPKVRYVAPPDSARLAVGITATRLGNRAGTLTFAATRAAHVRVTVFNGGRSASSTTADAVPGSNTIALRSLALGAPNRVVLRATTDAGQQATDSLTNLFPGRRLSRKIVKSVATDAVFEIPSDGGESDKASCPKSVHGSRARCKILGSVDGSPFSCVFFTVVSVGRDGQVYRQDRSCKHRVPLGRRIAAYPS